MIYTAHPILCEW